VPSKVAVASFVRADGTRLADLGALGSTGSRPPAVGL